MKEEKKVYAVEWINRSEGTVCLVLNKDILVMKLQDVTLLGFNKLWATIN